MGDEGALNESQSAAVWRCGGAVGWSLRFGATLTMLGQSTGRVYQFGMASECCARRLGWVHCARHPATAASPAVFLGSIVISEENGADSDSEWEWAARGGLGGRCAQRAGRAVCQWHEEEEEEEEEEEGPGADEGVLWLLAHIYTETADGGAGGVFSCSSESSIGHF